MNPTCECLGDSYSSYHCEITADHVMVYQIVSKSFAYVVISTMHKEHQAIDFFLMKETKQINFF